MAAPPDLNMTNLSGKFVMNKPLTDDLDAMFVIQGLGWMFRKAFNLVSVVMTVKSYNDNEGMFHIDITSVAASLATTQEFRQMDWLDGDHPDKVFGLMRGRSRMYKRGQLQPVVSEEEEDRLFLEGQDSKDDTSKWLDEDLCQSYAASVKGGWRAEQIWGFEEVNGERRYCRRIVTRKGDDVQRVRLVFDYRGPLAPGEEMMAAEG